MERELLPDHRDRLAVVCGSGSRVIPLLRHGVSRVSVIDLSHSQLALCELRIELLRKLDLDGFRGFLGYPGGTPLDPGSRRRIFESLELRPGSRSLLSGFFEAASYGSPILLGRWERTFIGFSKLARLLLGRKRIEALFSCTDLEEQQRVVAREFSGSRWWLLLAIAGNARLFNALLYSGEFPSNNTGLSYVRYYESAFSRLFKQGLARENFFLELTLRGALDHGEAVPAEASPEVFSEAKAALGKIEIEWVEEDLVNWLSRNRGFSFVSFSNVASYFKPPLEQEFLSRILPSLEDGGRVVLRHYLHRPESLDRGGYRDITSRFAEPIRKEKMQMYEVEVLERITA